jgi:hypothetical protein
MNACERLIRRTRVLTVIVLSCPLEQLIGQRGIASRIHVSVQSNPGGGGETFRRRIALYQIRASPASKLVIGIGADALEAISIL